jgi:hypothetical protein
MGTRKAVVLVVAATVTILLGWRFLGRGTPPEAESPPRLPDAPPSRDAPPVPPPAPGDPPAEVGEPVTPEPAALTVAPAPVPAPDAAPLSFSGTVRDADGGPVEGARVRPEFDSYLLLGPDGTPFAAPVLERARTTVKEGSTDPDGTYRLEVDLPANGTLPLLASAPGFVQARRGLVAVAGNLRRSVDFVLERARTIEGRVVDQEGAPVTGADVSARRPGFPDTTDGVRSGPDGRFLIPDAPLGACVVTASAPPVAPRGAWIEARTSAEATPEGGSVELVLRWADAKGATVRVVVVDGATGERILVKRAALTPLDGWYSEKLSTAPVRARMEPGAVALDAVRPGSWRIWVETVARGVQYADLRVERGAREVEGRIEVRPAGSLRGRIHANGVPVPAGGRFALSVELHGNGSFPSFTFRDDADPGGPGRREQPHRVVTADADGTFRVGDLLPGRYRVALLQDGVSAVADAEVPSGREASVDLQAARSARLSFRIARPSWGRAWHLAAWEEGGIRKPGSVVATRGEETVVVERDCHPGRVHWLAEWKDAPDGDRHGLRRVADGTVEVAPGERRTVEVPLPEEDPAKETR